MDNKKRILLAIGFIVLTVLIGWLLYRVFFYRPPLETLPADTTLPPSTSTDAFPTSGEGITRTPTGQTGVGLPPRDVRPTEELFIREQPVAPRVSHLVTDFLNSPTPAPGGGAQFYNEQDGRFYRILPDGSLELLSEQVFFNVEQATWANAGDKAILEYPDGSNIYFNFETEQQVTLPQHWENFSFAQTGDQIAAKSVGLAPENRWLVVSNPDGSQIQTVARLGDNADKVEVQWSPARDVLGFSQTGDPLGGDRQEILLVGQHGENFKSLVVEGRGFESQWSPTGKQLLYSVHSARTSFKPEVWISEAQGDDIGKSRRPLRLNTWAEKCTFASEQFVYCGVPTELETGIGFAPELADTIPDRLMRVDIQTGIQTEIQLEDTHVIDSLFVGEDGKTLYFTDKTQQGIFQVEL